uniref:Reverse transcriptase Ty1/copia-type domain-containing protein n=1 Tax=Tanacetum cinerariifolium TaxID=118510 RepID=A0A6L2KTQ1_TANCI|nr:hypothetical protein [Tanacetum cinerariifolium]
MSIIMLFDSRWITRSTSFIWNHSGTCYISVQWSMVNLLPNHRLKRKLLPSFVFLDTVQRSVEHKNSKKSNEMYYPWFTKVIIHHFMSKDPSIPSRNKVNCHYVRDDHMFSTIKLVSRHQNTQQLGALQPIELTNEEIKNSNAYKEYYAVAIGAAPPKPKASNSTDEKGDDEGKDGDGDEEDDGDDGEERDGDDDDEDDDGEEGDDDDQEVERDDDKDDEEEGRDDEQEYDDEGYDEETRDEESFDPIPKTPENSDDEGNGKEDLGLNVGREEEHNEEEEEDELYRDVNINQGRGIQATLEVKDSHVTLTPVNLDGQQQSSSVSSQFVTSMPNPTLDVGMELIFETTLQMDVQTPTSVAPLPMFAPTMTPFTFATIYTTSQAPILPTTALSTIIQDLPNFSSLFGFDNRLRILEANFFEFMQTNQFAGAVFAIPGIVQRYMDQRMNEAKIIKEQVKEQVKVQVSKILPRIEQTVNEQLQAEVLTRSFHSSKTSYDVAVDLSEMELKKILIEKMEGNKETVTLKRRRNYDADKDEEPSAGPDRRSKRRREGKEPESASAPKEKATRSTGKSTQGSKSRQASASESGLAEEPMQTTFQMEKPSHPEFDTGAEDQPIVQSSQHPEWFSQQHKPPTLDHDWNKTLSAVNTLTPELLVGPTYELMKGSSKSLVELEYHLEEVFKAITDQLDLVNPESQQYPHNLLQPLPLIPNNQGRRVISFEHFINNALEYLCGGASNRKYTTFITKTKAADYRHIKWIEDLGRKRQQFYGFVINRESARHVYSKRRIITITELKIVEWHNYKHLDWITVRKDDDKLYKFKEGDFKRLRIQDIEDMLLLLVQGKLTNLKVEERFAFNNKDKKNRLMQIDELHKFSDGTLTDVRTALDDRLKGIWMSDDVLKLENFKKDESKSSQVIKSRKYLQNEYYALWKVIEFGDSYQAPPEEAGKGSASESFAKKKGRTVAITTEDMQKRKNDVKARTTLLLALLDEHQLRFSKLQAIVSHLEFMDVEIEQDDLNQKFLTSLAPEWLIGNGEVHTASVPNASTQVSTASIDVAAASISHDIVCAYIASQSNGSQVKYEDITQIDEDDIEEMDIKSDVAGFDKSKVECFNFHKMGHFARECRAPRSQDRGKRESYRQGPKKEEQAPKALMAIDGIKWDWSYMANEEENHALVADEEVPTKFALMAKSSLISENKVYDDSYCSKSCRKNTKNLNTKISKLSEKLSDCETNLYHYKLDLTKSNTSDLQNSNFSVSEHGESSDSIMSKPMIKFVKAADCPKVVKTNKTKTVKKLLIKYAEMYRSYSISTIGCGKITGKGIIKTGKLEFENVYFVKELKYNLSNVSQICDNKNSVLFTDSKCIVLGKDFKLKDDTNVLLRTPRQHNMYSIDLNNVVPHKNLTCLVAKASVDKSTKDVASQVVKKDVSFLRCIALPNWFHKAHMKFSNSDAQDAYNANAPESRIRPSETKWVLKNKKDERGIVIRNKAMLVTQGHTQEEGIDYEDVFAPVARIEAIRLFIAYATFMRFTVYHMDVKSTFLYGTIDEEVYVMRPPRFQDPEFPDRVYKVEKATYELHQAPRAWYGTLSKYLLDNGFQKGTIDQTLFIRMHRGDFLLVQVSANTPMDKENPWRKDGPGKDVELHLYRSMIRSLMYLTASRPDIMFDVCACARHQVTPKECHLYFVKRIFRYLKGHPKLGLWYPKESPFDLVVYSDSDYGGATQDRKSTTGGCQFLGRRLISWQCKKQTIVATSTTKAEYVAAASGCGQVL